MSEKILPIIQVGDVLVSPSVFTEYFCCDFEKCKGQCCIEGDAGAPLLTEEVAEIENVLDTVFPELSASAQSVIDQQGVAYIDEEGDLVTSIVGGKDCVFTCYNSEGCCLCSLEKAFREGRTQWCKPISCSLYPIRVTGDLGNGTVGLNYHEWKVCRDAVIKGKKERIRVYEFLKEPLTRRFSAEWYQQLCEAAEELKKMGYL